MINNSNDNRESRSNMNASPLLTDVFDKFDRKPCGFEGRRGVAVVDEETDEVMESEKEG